MRSSTIVYASSFGGALTPLWASVVDIKSFILISACLKTGYSELSWNWLPLIILKKMVDQNRKYA